MVSHDTTENQSLEEKAEGFPVLKISSGNRETFLDLVAQETALTIFFNNKELVTLLCSPTELEYLAVGFLTSEGFIQEKEEIKKLIIDEEKGTVWVETTEGKDFVEGIMFKRLITSSCGRGTSFCSATETSSGIKNSTRKISANEILKLTRMLQESSQLYRATGGAHSAALCDEKGKLVFSEDIGRHNAIDKLFGKCLLENLETENKILVTSGRITSETLLKATKRKIPIIVSKSAPTNLAIKLANKLGVTIVGFARGKRINVYCHDWRIID